MMRGYRNNFSSSGAEAAFTEIPYLLYDVYVYWGGASSNSKSSVSNTMGINVASTSVNATKYFYDAYKMWDGTFDESTATTTVEATNAGDGKDYVIFRGLTDDAFTLSTNWKRNNINGVQVVQVPEPVSMLLAACGGLMALARRRR